MYIKSAVSTSMIIILTACGGGDGDSGSSAGVSSPPAVAAPSSSAWGITVPDDFDYSTVEQRGLVLQMCDQKAGTSIQVYGRKTLMDVPVEEPGEVTTYQSVNALSNMILLTSTDDVGAISVDFSIASSVYTLYASTSGKGYKEMRYDPSDGTYKAESCY